MRTMYKKSMAVCLLYFACFGVRAAEIPVNIYGLSNVATIQSAIQTAISSASAGDVVKVTNNDMSSDVPYNSANANLTLDIPVNVTVLWSMEYSSSAVVNPLITLNGTGAFTVSTGGSVTHTYNGVAIRIAGAITVTVENGGLISSGGTGTAIASDAISVEAGGVTVNVNSNGTVKRLTGTSTSPVIHVGNNLTNVVINVNEGSVISEGSGLAIEDGTTTGSTSNTLINISNDAVVQCGTSRTIYSTGTGSVVTVSGGTVSNTSNSNLISVIYMDGGTGENVRVTGGTVKTLGANGYTIQTTGDVLVSSGLVTAINGRAINLVGTNSKATVSGGTVEATGTGRAIGTASTNPATVPNTSVVITGGVVSSTSGNAIHVTGDNSTVTVTDGIVKATTGYAIYALAATSSIAVDGGFVFAYGTNITGTSPATGFVTNSAPTITNGVLVAWNQNLAGANPTYYAGTSLHLENSSGATATWQKVGTSNGIAYANGANTGFFPLNVQIIYPIYPDANGIVYVDHTQSGNGSSWTNAYPNLADPLLQAAISGTLITQIWVAEGTYYPMHTADGYDLTGQVFDVSDGGRDNAFVLVPDVKIYGGFAAPLPTGTTPPALGTTGRNGETILSGDINGDGTPNGNTYHIVIGVGISNANTLIDGFTISGGNANGSSTITVNGVTIEHDLGGGMYHVNASPTIMHVTLSGNSAANQGGGLYNSNSSPKLINGIISENTAMNGGGMLNDNAVPVLTNITMSRNSASGSGGGMMNVNGSSPGIRNSIIWGNTATTTDNNVHNDIAGTDNPVYSYSLVERNSGLGGTWDSSLGTDGGNNLPCDADPLFEDVMTGDYRLKPGSPAIEEGNNNLYLTTRGISNFTDITDLAGNQRLMGERIDMGAFETIVYLVTVMSDGTGATGDGYYGEAEVVNIDAGTEPAGYRFVGWTTTDAGVFFDNDANPVTFFVMPDNAVTVTAVFEELFTVTVMSAGPGSSGGGSYLPGEVVNIYAGTDPAVDHQFLGWTTTSAGVTFAVPGDRTTSFVMPANDVTVIAEFDNLYVVVVQSVGTGATGSGYYHEDDIVTINAGTPPAGLEFSEWTAVPEVILANANSVTTTFVMPTNMVIVTAGFCGEGDKKAFEDALLIFESTGWIVCEQNVFTVERLLTLLTEQINHVIDTTGITAVYSNISINDIILPAVNMDGSFNFDVTLTQCSYIRTLSLTCVIAFEPYSRIVRLITIDETTDGRIISDKLYAATDDTVTLTILPDDGYQLDEIKAFHTGYDTIPVLLTGDGAIRTFLMPPHVVTVTATFTVTKSVGVPQTESGLKTYVLDGVLYVSGVPQGGTVRVYTILGTLVAAPSNSLEGREFVLPLPGRGIYIITDGQKTIKIKY